MSNKTCKTFVVAISMSSLCLSAVSLGAPGSGDESISGKRPLLTPLGHTNQDDEAKRFYLPDLDVKDPDPSGIHSMIDLRSVNLIEIALMSSGQDFSSDQPINDFTDFPIQLDVDVDFDTGFTGDFSLLEMRNIDSAETQPEFNSLNIPAPGVLTLLAIAGLSRGRRKR
ncbi:MAG: hypothetical protein MK089_02020 [Phycisphaerales bacterium]|nr:hypothetical protein [Phycisphaerales bacterium]